MKPGFTKNEYERKLDELTEARKRWQESEYVLHFLRTQTGTPTPPTTDEQILQWHQQLQQQRPL